jgi:hypothetical protein
MTFAPFLAILNNLYKATCAGVSYFAFPMITMTEIVRTKNAISLNKLMIGANLLSTCMWISYGYFGLHDALVWGPNLVGLIFTVFQIALKLYYPSVDNGPSEAETINGTAELQQYNPIHG